MLPEGGAVDCSPHGAAGAAAVPAPAPRPAPPPAPAPRAAAPPPPAAALAPRWMTPMAKFSGPMSTTLIVRSTPGSEFTFFTSSSVM
ncbi:MAG: hypothetical protein DMF94_32010 [Acidobacteria bacterium]|nr:MAG: hypothetical protein DMF96_14550 [Acidobacteriota bacterium]PYR15442.1 MAG: hypothetical protein DMF94_32010 [Acidobacteriota bacterium]